jgi:cytochrome c oxidase subunit 4
MRDALGHAPLRVLGALVVLAALSFGATYLPLGAFTMAVALAFAAVKTALVAIFFMELGHETPTIRLAAIVGPLFLALLVTFVATDILFR